MSKVTILGGGGIRTPLLIHGLVRAPLGLTEIALFDPDAERAGMMAALGTIGNSPSSSGSGGSGGGGFSGGGSGGGGGGAGGGF